MKLSLSGSRYFSNWATNQLVKKKLASRLWIRDHSIFQQHKSIVYIFCELRLESKVTKLFATLIVRPKVYIKLVDYMISNSLWNNLILCSQMKPEFTVRTLRQCFSCLLLRMLSKIAEFSRLVFSEKKYEIILTCMWLSAQVYCCIHAQMPFDFKWCFRH